MIFFSCRSELVITLARPTSEPVPAVVGTAITGAMVSALARVHQSPISSKSQIGRVCPAMNAITLPRSSAEPPPKAMTPSKPPSRYIVTPASAFLSVGFASTSENNAAPRPASFISASVRWVISLSANPRSVTSSGLAIPADWQTSPISLMRPAPKRIGLG